MVTFFGIGIPLAYVFGFEKIPIEFIQENLSGVRGLVFGLCLGISLNVASFTMLVSGPGNTKRWQAAIESAQKRG